MLIQSLIGLSLKFKFPNNVVLFSSVAKKNMHTYPLDVHNCLKDKPPYIIIYKGPNQQDL